ncbi:MAG: PDZ domain-containing protein, partial [Planctomycetota bacterium]
SDVPEVERATPGPSVSPPGGRPVVVRFPLLFFLLILLAVVLVVPYLAEEIPYAITRGKERAKAEVARRVLAENPAPEARFPLIVKAVAPSVVGIETVRPGKRTRDEWSAFFPPPRFHEEGLGSGVIVDPEGYIVTNFHVIDQAESVTVRLSDGRILKDVRVVGADPVNDLAVLKISAANLVVAAWGDSDELEPGDPVLAIGNPYGLIQTVTAGIVSAKQRRAETNQGGYQEYLQTDAALNPGNSGGPLVDMDGRIVGINTAIFGDAYQGISFAIPSRIAKDIYEKLKTNRRIVRGWLGVRMTELTETMALELGLDTTRGAVVLETVPRSPAAKAGIQPGDIILRWNDTLIEDPAALSIAVARSKVGSQAEVEIYRDGRTITVTVEVAERPARFP